MSSPVAGFFRRCLIAVFGTAAVSIAAFLLLRNPALASSLSSLPAGITSEWGAALAALVAGFGAGAILAALLFREPDRAAGLALAALQGDDTPADESEAGDAGGDLRAVAARLSEWRHRARQADLAHRRLEEVLARLAREIEEVPRDSYRPLKAGGNPEAAERTLVRAVNGLLESAKRSRDSAAALLARIEEDLDRAVEPLEDAGRRMTAGSKALDRSLVTMSRALALVVRAEMSSSNGKPGRAFELTPVKNQLVEAVRESYEARFSLEQCLTAVSMARRAGSHVEREVAAVRKRFGGADVRHLSESDFMPENGTKKTEPEIDE